jgi:hypothetical protein
MRAEPALVTIATLRWLAGGANALVVGALAGRRHARRTCRWLTVVLLGLALHLVEEPLLHAVWPQLMQQGPRP